MNVPAFKEWHAIVEALAGGEQILILRKGGIAEGRGGFQVKANRFWLLPTFFHAQRQKLKPGAEKWLSVESQPAPPTNPFVVSCFAEITAHKFLDDWAKVVRLDSFHLWSEVTLQERFAWSKPSGLHAFVVRVHRLGEPFSVAASPEIAGCKSWVELSTDFDTVTSTPVLADDDFNRQSAAIQSIW